MLFQCRSTVFYDGPALKQHSITVLLILDYSLRRWPTNKTALLGRRPQCRRWVQVMDIEDHTMIMSWTRTIHHLYRSHWVQVLDIEDHTMIMSWTRTIHHLYRSHYPIILRSVNWRCNSYYYYLFHIMIILLFHHQSPQSSSLMLIHR